MLTRLTLLTSRNAPRLMTANCMVSRRYDHSASEIEKIPPYFRNITYDDVPIPQGSWQAKYDEQNKTYNKILGGSAAFLALTIYIVFETHKSNWMTLPDEPAERWYPLDRFAEGNDGKSVI